VWHLKVPKFPKRLLPRFNGVALRPADDVLLRGYGENIAIALPTLDQMSKKWTKPEIVKRRCVLRLPGQSFSVRILKKVLWASSLYISRRYSAKSDKGGVSIKASGLYIALPPKA
jgi:hypothetical protein